MYHYKTKTPKQTIKNIDNFFKKKGLTVKIQHFEISEIGTWSCALVLKFNNIIINRSNGKGITKDLALASGYGELYERFCNKIGLEGGFLYTDKIMQYNKKHFGYSIDPEEKILPINSVLQDQSNCDLQLNNCEKLFGSKENSNLYINFICGDNFIGIPYKNLFTDEIKYFDFRLIPHLYTSSTGMCAGNSFYEAINQGISEILERKIYNDFLISDKKNYKLIDLSSIENKKLKQYIKKIQIDNEFYLFDLSYDFKAPVLYGLFKNKTTGGYWNSVGCFPIFDIALERVITEAYQNIGSLELSTMRPQLLSKNFSQEYFAFMSFVNYNQLPAYKDNILNNTFITTYNTEYFIKAKNNKQIFNYYQNLLKTKNITLYYKDTSLTSSIFSYKILLEESLEAQLFSELYKKISLQDKTNLIFIHNEVLLTLKQIVFNYKPIDQLLELLNTLKNNLTEEEISYLIHITNKEELNPFPDNGNNIIEFFNTQDISFLYNNFLYPMVLKMPSTLKNMRLEQYILSIIQTIYSNYDDFLFLYRKEE